MNDNNGNKKDNVENMALAELLGMAEGSDDGRVQERDDEPGSGIAKLAMMVATTSIEAAKKPSISPNPVGSTPPAASASSIPARTSSIPPGSMAPPMGSVPPGSMAPPMMGSVPPSGMSDYPSYTANAPTEAMSAAGYQRAETVPFQNTAQGYSGAGMQTPRASMQTPMVTTVDGASLSKSKPKIGMFIGIGGGAVALIATALFLVMGGEKKTEQDAQVAQLQAKLDALAQKQAIPEPQAAPPTAAPTPAPAEEEAPKEAAVAEKVPDEVASAAVEEPAEEEEEEVEEEQPLVKPAKMTRAQRKKWAKAKKAAAKRAKKAKKAQKAAKAQKADAAKNKEKASKGNDSALGSLLDNDVASGQKSASGAIPSTPSRSDVKTAMRPVQAKASKCAKYSKGTVKLKVVVGNNGRVKSSTVVGGSAEGNAANCVAMIARTAKFPKFSNPTFSFNYPVTLK